MIIVKAVRLSTSINTRRSPYDYSEGCEVVNINQYSKANLMIIVKAVRLSTSINTRRSIF